MVGMASAINRPPLRGFRNCGRGISLGINVQQLDSAVESSHREISEPSLDALGCLVSHFAGKDERRTAAVQDASRDLAPRKFRQVLDCGCPSAAFGAADLVTDTFNHTPCSPSRPAYCFEPSTGPR